MSKAKNKNWGKSKCCKAEVEYTGGGYDGEDVVPVESYCTNCHKAEPKIIQRVGRPRKVDLVF